MANDKWKFITINIEKYQEQYKEIYANAILNGYTIPILLQQKIPQEYDFTYNESEKLSQKISEENGEKLNQKYGEIRKLEIEWDKGKATDKDVKEFLLNELEEFLKAFPQYKELIIKYNEDTINAI